MPSSEMFTFVVNHISVISCVVLIIMLLNKRNSRVNLYKFFTCFVALLLLLNIGTLLQTYNKMISGEINFIFILIIYIGLCFFPIVILFLGWTFKNPHMKMRLKHLLFLFFPVLSLVFICVPYLRTHYFFINYSVYSDEAVYGFFYYIHSIYSYVFVFIGMINMLYFSIKNAGFFSKQSLFILIGIAVAVSANFLYSFNIIKLTFDITSCSLVVASICFAIAIIKFKFLAVVPIALKKIIDIISDGFVVIDLEYKIIDYNNSMLRHFNNISLKRNDDIRIIIAHLAGKQFTVDEFESLFTKLIEKGQTITVEKQFKGYNFDKFFEIEFSPVFTDGKIIGIILLFRDITRQKKDLEIIRESMAVMLERERLATLGQMVGGIAHNLKTPILSISGGLEAISDLVSEYDNSIDDQSVTREDHHEIAGEIVSWVEKIRAHCSYISDMITTIKGQAVHLNSFTNSGSFHIDEFVKRLELLIKHELYKYHCCLNINMEIPAGTEVAGEINSLVQIFDNLILNSISSYKGKEGVIDLKIVQQDDTLKFYLTDYGCGMSGEIKSKLFKEMITTKGKDGTGLGLYMSYATIKGIFKGNMEVISELNKGSTFIVSLPYIKNKII